MRALHSVISIQSSPFIARAPTAATFVQSRRFLRLTLSRRLDTLVGAFPPRDLHSDGSPWDVLSQDICG